MTAAKSAPRNNRKRRASGKNPVERKSRREEFVIRTLKPITPSSLVVQRRLRIRFLFAIPFILAIVGVFLLVVRSQLPFDSHAYGLFALFIGIFWASANFITGSPRRLVASLESAALGDRDLEQLMNLLEGLCVQNGLAVPRVCLLEDRSINALVVGWNDGDAVLIVTTGILVNCTRIELEGVIAHELAHIKRGDMRDAAFASVACGLISLVTSRSARLVRALLSPSREANADIGGAAMTRYPPGLILALLKISGTRTKPARLSKRVARLSAPCWFQALEESSRRRVVVGDLDVQERIGLLAEL